MCGIFGIMSYGVENEYKQTQETAIRIIGTEILQLLEDRGGDATGVAALFEDCNYMGLKMGVAATEFLSRFGSTKEDYEGWLDIMKKKESPTKMFIGHCRKSSVGNSIDNVNNHPIYIENKIIGVHNGTLTNHDAIFHNLECKRDGIVDSEAIFRLLYHFLNDGKDPFTKEAIQETCKRIHGTYSVIALNAINPNQIAVFRDGRPLAFALIKKLNILLIASEEKYIKHAVFRYNKLSSLYKLGNDFAKLTKKDISFNTLLDDNLVIFDNRVEITKDIKINDLIHAVKILRNDKVWKTKIIKKFEIEKELEKENNNTDTDNNIDTNDTNIDDNNIVITNNVLNLTSSGLKNNTKINSSIEETCILWSKKFDKLNLIKDDIVVEKLLSIEIDTINNEIFEIKNLIKTKVFKYSIVSKQANNLLLGEYAKQFVTLVEDSNTEVLLGKSETVIYINEKIYVQNEENNNTTKKIIITEKDKNDSIEVNVNINTKAIKISEMASKYSIKRYMNNEEAMEAIDITDLNIIEALPFYSLCNRIKRFSFKDGFYSGYTKRISEENNLTSSDKVDKFEEKKNKAEKKIRVLKTLSKVLSKVLFSCTKFNIFDIGGDLTSMIKNKQEIDSKTLKSIYSKKDLEDYEAINKITTLLELKNKEIN